MIISSGVNVAGSCVGSGGLVDIAGEQPARSIKRLSMAQIMGKRFIMHPRPALDRNHRRRVNSALETISD